MNTLSPHHREASFEFWMRDHFEDVQNIAQSFTEWKFLSCHIQAICNLLGNEEDLKRQHCIIQEKERLMYCSTQQYERLSIPLLLMGCLFGLEAVKLDLLWMFQQLKTQSFLSLLSEEFLFNINLNIQLTMQRLHGRDGHRLQALVDCFGLEDKLVFAPIAHDWEDYNNMSTPRYGEVTKT